MAEGHSHRNRAMRPAVAEDPNIDVILGARRTLVAGQPRLEPAKHVLDLVLLIQHALHDLWVAADVVLVLRGLRVLTCYITRNSTGSSTLAITTTATHEQEQEREQ